MKPHEETAAAIDLDLLLREYAEEMVQEDQENAARSAPIKDDYELLMKETIQANNNTRSGK